MEKPNITKKQYLILNYLYRFRFLNRRQLSILMNHKDPRRLNAWLSDLTKKGIIGRIYSRKIGEGNKPAIYYLAQKSIRLLIDCFGVERKWLENRVYREKKDSERFRIRSNYIANMYLGLKRKAAVEKESLLFFTKVDLIPHKYLIHPLPDAYIAFGKGVKIKRYFVEYIDPDCPRFVMRNRLTDYIEYYQSKKFQKTTKHPFPSTLIICPNETTKKFLIKEVTKQREIEYLENLSFYVSSFLNSSWKSV